jgi:metal-responsive CopG/Arc/MetJ family transcriptional regulator
MKSVAKIGFSIPVETLRSLERVRGQLKSSRSAAITEAIEQWLASYEVTAADAKYARGYLRVPEAVAESSAVAAAATATWEPWE